MSDTIKQFSKRKGFESLPRELLQSKELSLEAIGLLCNLQSYPSNWVLHKTELRKRFKNSEKVVDRIWDELVSCNYIIQFRRREGKRFNYQYFFNVEKFNFAEIQELCFKMNQENMVLYHKEMNGKKEINYLDYIFLSDSDKENLDLSFWTSQIRNSKKDDEINDSWTCQYGKSNMEIPYTEGNRFNTNRSTTKKSDIFKEDEEDYLKRLVNLISDNSDYKNLTLILRAQDVEPKSVYRIIDYFSQGIEFDKGLIKQQLDWMSVKSKEDGIGDFAEYFVRGYEKRLESRNGSNIEDLDALLGIDRKELDGIMHDWLDE